MANSIDFPGNCIYRHVRAIIGENRVILRQNGPLVGTGITGSIPVSPSTVYKAKQGIEPSTPSLRPSLSEVTPKLRGMALTDHGKEESAIARKPPRGFGGSRLTALTSSAGALVGEGPEDPSPYRSAGHVVGKSRSEVLNG